MNTHRKVAYSLSAMALLCFFLFPEPNIAVVGALLLQTAAYITVAGKSPVDGFFLVGISFLLMGIIRADNPLIADSQMYENARWWLIIIGAGLCMVTLPVMLRPLLQRR